jgi:hypothetical protein
MMRKRKGHGPTETEENAAAYGRIQYKRPPARDGHTGTVFDDNLIIFGGDRHHMPFNDSHLLELDKQIAAKEA